MIHAQQLLKTFQTTVVRWLSYPASQAQQSRLQALLRPFIFMVHPDLFTNLPYAREVNEKSLASLNEYIQAIRIENGRFTAGYEGKRRLMFYQRIPQTPDHARSPQQVEVSLGQDVILSIKRLLTQSKLDDNEIDLPTPTQGQSDRPIDWINAVHYTQTGKAYPFTDIYDELSRVRTALTLSEWLSKNLESACKRDKKSQQLRRMTTHTLREVTECHSLQSIQWISLWNAVHRLSAVRALDRVLSSHSDIAAKLCGRCVMFSDSGSGVLQTGAICLSTDQTDQQWTQFLRRVVNSSSNLLQENHKMEQRLSHLLHGMQVIHRNRPPYLTVEQYHTCLSFLISHLGMAHQLLPSRGDLSQLSAIVENLQSGQNVTLTEEGYFCIAHTSPAWSITNFIRDNLTKAPQVQQLYNKQKLLVDELTQELVEMHKLNSLSYDPSIGLDNVLTCVEQLRIDTEYGFRDRLKDLRLHITPYFSVSSDGQVNIKYDYWKDNR